MEIFFTADALIALLTLTLLEIVLGIDNIVFISILSGKLPVEQQDKARKIGLFLAMFPRILLLFSLSWVMSLVDPIFSLANLVGVTDPDWVSKLAISGRDLILVIGGLFLIYKSTTEIHHKIEGVEENQKDVKVHSFTNVIFQILILDVVFSLDSVITAVGMVKHIEIMIAAVILLIVLVQIFQSIGTKLSLKADKRLKKKSV